MGTPFTYKWGPGRLASLGIRLSEDQAATTETSGFAMVLVPWQDPTTHDPFQMCDEDGLVVAPAIVRVTLNDEMSVPTHVWGEDVPPSLDDPCADLQDYLDRTMKHYRPQWRTHAKAVIEKVDPYDMESGWTDNGGRRMFVGQVDPLAVWDAVMIDGDQAARGIEAIQNAVHDSDVLMAEEFNYLLNDAMLRDYDGNPSEEWTEFCETYSVDPALSEDGMPTADLEFHLASLKPDWEFHFDPDLAEAWRKLHASSRSNWDAYTTAYPPKKVYRRGARYLHDPLANPWLDTVDD